MNRPPALLAVFWLTACGVTTLPVPADSRIIVALPKDDSALARAESAFVAEGLRIDSRSGSTVTTMAIGYWRSRVPPLTPAGEIWPRRGRCWNGWRSGYGGEGTSSRSCRLGGCEITRNSASWSESLNTRCGVSGGTSSPVSAESTWVTPAHSIVSRPLSTKKNWRAARC